MSDVSVSASAPALAGLAAHRRLADPTASSADLLAGAPRLVHAATLALVALVAAFVLWAAFARIEEVTIGQGRVIPASRIQLVQSLEGGIVKAIHAGEGALVERGDLLIQIDPTGFGSNLDEARERIAALRLKRARLIAEATGASPDLPADLAASHSEASTRQMAEYEARQSALTSALATSAERVSQRRQEMAESHARIASLEESLRLARAELDLTRPLLESGAAAKVEVLRLEARIVELEGSIEATRLAIPRLEAAAAEAASEADGRKATFRADALKELNATDMDLAAIEQSMRADADRVARTDLRAPVRGIVQRLHVTTVGQVVRPGNDIVEIVPVDDTLLVEARITPRDVAFLRPGQQGIVKISAYDYGIYGSLEARLERISADAITTEKGDSYYLIEVRTSRAYLERNGKRLPIMPGMVAEVDMVTGERTVLQYLMKPFTRLRAEALRER
ncbi:MAG: HlyD family type I secretion periplasmic adaptor subunit [Hyphomicrobiaceae bacterium]